MYRTCLHCLGELGTNTALPGLPVGRTLAWDAAEHRLWVVCPTCARWNLVPASERERAIAALQRFPWETADAVGAIRFGSLDDGSRVLQLGAASATEKAEWRYGNRLLARRRRFARLRWLRRLSTVFTGTLLSPGVAGRWRVVGMLDGRPVRRADLEGAEFLLDESTGTLDVTGLRRDGRALHTEDPGALLDRMLLCVTLEGAPERTIQAAADYLENRGPGRVLSGLADTSAEEPRGALRILYEGEGDWRGEWSSAGGFVRVPRHRLLALEMAREAQAEGVALRGAARALEARWREADALARIADAL